MHAKLSHADFRLGVRALLNIDIASRCATDVQLASPSSCSSSICCSFGVCIPLGSGMYSPIYEVLLCAVHTRCDAGNRAYLQVTGCT